MNQIQDFIAVFDSGVGGLSVLRELTAQMPGERFLYFGDSANAPYGTRPARQVRQLTLAAAEALVRRGIKALVVACNTATAAAIADLRAAYPELIVVGMEPALKPAAERFPGGRIGVMATPVTLHQQKFDQLLHRFDHTCRIAEIPAPGLVELIESGQADSPRTRALLEQLLLPWAGKLDALVLGCTHYPFVSRQIQEILGPDTALLDGAPGTARETRRRLEAAGLLAEGPGEVLLENSRADMLPLCAALLAGPDPISPAGAAPSPRTALT